MVGQGEAEPEWLAWSFDFAGFLDGGTLEFDLFFLMVRWDFLTSQ